MARSRNLYDERFVHTKTASDLENIEGLAHIVDQWNSFQEPYYGFPTRFSSMSDLRGPRFASKPVWHFKGNAVAKAMPYQCKHSDHLWQGRWQISDHNPEFKHFIAFCDGFLEEANKPVVSAALLSEVTSRLRDKVAPQIANYYLGIAESVDSVVLDLNDLTRATQSIKGAMSALQSAGLGYIWGVFPAVSEIKQVHEGVDSLLDKFERLQALERGTETSANEKLTATYDFSYVVPKRRFTVSTFQWTVSGKMTRSIIVNSSIKVQAPAGLTSWMDRMLDAFQLLPSPQSWWDGVPFSFLVDRVLPISNAVNAGRDYLGSLGSDSFATVDELKSVSCYNKFECELKGPCHDIGMKYDLHLYRRNDGSMFRGGVPAMGTMSSREAWHMWNNL